MKVNLYPLKFEPILKEKIWGGTKLNSILDKKSNSPLIGESWEISDIQEDNSIVSNGDLKGMSLKALLENYTSDLIAAGISNVSPLEICSILEFTTIFASPSTHI